MKVCLLFAIVGLAAAASKPKGLCCKAMTAECQACAAGQTVLQYCTSNPTTPGCPTKYEYKTMSTTYQLGSYPYLAVPDATGKSVVPAVVQTVDECKDLCRKTNGCKYGTFVTAESKMEAENHDY